MENEVETWIIAGSRELKVEDEAGSKELFCLAGRS